MNLNESIAGSSLKKDRIREKYRIKAKNEEAKLRSQIRESSGKRSDHSLMAGCGAGCLGVILFLAAVSIFDIMLGGMEPILMIAFFVGGFLLVKANAGTKNNEENYSMESRIAQIYKDCEEEAQREMAVYDAKVKQYYERVIKNEPGLKDMKDHMVMMFGRMIQHASTESNQKFIDAALHYKVVSTAIQFYFESQYTNKNDDYNFDAHRFRNLASLEECEGLAQALARMTVKEMKMMYPPNSMKIDVSHNDADVRLHYRGPNKNYVPPRPIA